MNDTRVDHDDLEPDDERMLQVSTFESLMIQVLVNQLTEIVESQGRSKRVSYDNQYKQAQTLQSLAQTALMLTDSETIFLHGGKLQSFFNRVFLEHTLGTKPHDRTITKNPADDAPDTPSPESPTEPG
jgi:hypothetical protein